MDVVCADIFTLDLSRLNAIYVYPFPTIIGRLSEKIAAECRKGTRILVHDYPLEGLNPAKSVKIPEKSFHTTSYTSTSKNEDAKIATISKP